MKPGLLSAAGFAVIMLICLFIRMPETKRNKSTRDV